MEFIRKRSLNWRFLAGYCTHTHTHTHIHTHIHTESEGALFERAFPFRNIGKTSGRSDLRSLTGRCYKQ